MADRIGLEPKEMPLGKSQWAALGGLFSIMLFVAIIFTGCGGETLEPTHEGNTRGAYEVIVVDTPDGPITCVVWDSARAGGLDCNWEDK